VTFGLLFNFPVPNVDSGHPGYQVLANAAGRLAAVDERFSGWAEEVGVPVGSVSTPEEREGIVRLVDAAVSRLYGLNVNDVECIIETFHTGWKAEEREPYTEAVLEHLASFDWDPAPVGQE
jgi:hypothetical protein